MLLSLKYSIWPLLISLLFQAQLMSLFWRKDKNKFSGWGKLLRLGKLAFLLQCVWLGHTALALTIVAIDKNETFSVIYQWLSLGLLQISLLFAIAMSWEWHLKKYSFLVTFFVTATICAWLVYQGTYLTEIMLFGSMLVLLVWGHGAVRHARRTRRLRCQFIFLAWLMLVVLFIALPNPFWPLVYALGGVVMFAALQYALFGLTTCEGIQFPTSPLSIDTSALPQDNETVIKALEQINRQFQSEAAILGLYDNIFPSNSPFSSLTLEKIPLSSLLNCDSTTLTDDVADLSPRFFSQLVQCDVAVVIPFVPKESGKPVAWLLLKSTKAETAMRKSAVKTLYGDLIKEYSSLYAMQKQKYLDQEREITRLIAMSAALPAEINLIRNNLAGNRRPRLGFYVDRLIAQGMQDLQETLSQFNKQIVYLGRNRDHIWPLRKAFPGLRYYVGPNSKFFSSKSSVDVVIYDIAHINNADGYKFVNWLLKQQNPLTVFLIGPKKNSIIRDYETLNSRKKTVDIYEISSIDYEDVIKAITARGIQSLENIGKQYSLTQVTSEFESKILKQALIICDGNKSLATKVLGLKPHVFKRRLEAFQMGGFDPSPFRILEKS